MAPILWAGGPNRVDDGVFYSWASDEISYILDQDLEADGTLAQLVRGAFANWQDVPSSRIRFRNLGALGTNVDHSNFEDFRGDPRNPVILDSTGRIIEDELGAGSSNTVLGFATPILDFESTQIVAGLAVLNGLRASARSFDQVVTHEIGHMLGLDHTQANRDQASFPTTQKNVPLMYPLVQPSGPKSPLRDDVAWISWLYPESSFRPTTATIRGKVLRRRGGPFQGANVVAVRVNDEGAVIRPPLDVVSVVSDFLITNDGAYELPGLTPGSYAVFIEPLDSDFTRGSGVGPFDARSTNFPKDFYNSSEGPDDNPEEKTILRVEAGQTLDNIDIVANEVVNQLQLLGDDDQMIYEFPAGFRFPFFGQVYDEVFVNSDGNLSFGLGDSASSDRDQERFLSVPRVAPLFTDLHPQRPDRIITAKSDDGRITFTWNDIPEFAESGSPPGNRFSVSLFSNGDILFSYEKIHVTADSGLQAVVGVAPGGVEPGRTLDLSAQNGVVALDDTAVFEVFHENSFDLTGKQILFQATNAPLNRLYFPMYEGSAQSFSGFALTNLGTQSTQLQVTGRSTTGAILPFADNPHTETVAAKHQIAKLGSELFGISSSTAQNGWVEMTSTVAEVGSFFQIGNGLTGPATRLDGSVAFTEQLKVMYFTRLYEGQAVFRSAQSVFDAVTRLSIANPNQQTIRVKLRLFNQAGQPVSNEVDRTIPAQGFLRSSLRDLFTNQVQACPGLVSGICDGFVRAEVVEGPGAVGFAMIELPGPDTILGLNAVGPSLTAQLFSAQMAVGGGFLTSLKLVNVSAAPRTMTVTIYRDDGAILGQINQLALQPNQTFQRDLATILGASNGSPNAIVGSIRITADGPGVIGDVLFADPGDQFGNLGARYGAALSLQEKPYTRALFSQVANGSLGPGAALNLFTGAAFFNPGTTAIEITIQVFNREGALQEETKLALQPNQRIARLVEELLPKTVDLLRGYILIDSTGPLISQQLFGNIALTYLSAVPPKVLR